MTRLSMASSSASTSTSARRRRKIVIPQAALIADQQGTYVFAVEDGKAVVRRVKIGMEVGANVAIEVGTEGRRTDHRRRDTGR